MRSLLLEACLAGSFGETRKLGAGSVAIAGFCYLFGEPEPELAAIVKGEFSGRVLIPMSDGWREALAREPEYGSARRYAMKSTPALRDVDRLSRMERALPEGYSLRRMTAGDVTENPFGHGLAYPSPEAFERDGAGCCAVWDGRIASAASSFLTFAGCVETDISTLIAHRGKGLALACGAGFLRLCADLGLEARWDAQNPASRNLALRLGYELDEEYDVFVRREFLDRFA